MRVLSQVKAQVRSGVERLASQITTCDNGTNKTAPRHRANGVDPRGLADWIGVDW